MKVNHYQAFISAVFLFLVLGVKGLDFHSLSHYQGDEAAQCELCTFMVQHEAQEYTTPSSCDIPLQRTDIIEAKETLCEIPPYPGRLSPDSLFSRPPPVWV